MAVRNESVRLSLDDAGYSTGMARAATATALLDHHLDALDKHGTTASRRFTSMTARTDKFATSLGGMNTALGATNQGLADFGGNGGMGRFTRAASAGDSSINQLTGRLRLFADLAATLGPGLIPIAAVGVPAVTGLATALAAAGTAGAGALVAFQGVGDAITAVEKARLDPTVANLEAAQKAMAQIGPDAAQFVEAFQELRPVLGEIRDSAAAGLFPGLTEAMASFEELAPRIATLLEEVNRASGEAIANGVESLTTERWTPFFDFLTVEMPAAVTSLSRILGDLTHGAAEMWMAFDPGNDAFLGWLEDVADGFDKWASSAEATEGIEDFLDYVRETGPLVEDFFGSLVNLLVQVAQAAAPIGGPILQGLTAVADILATIADSDAGSAIVVAAAAMAALSRASAVWEKTSKTVWAQDLKGANGSIAAFGAMREGAIRGAAGIGLLAASMTDLDEKAGLANSTNGLLLGTLLKGFKGGAIGSTIGLILDVAAADDKLAASLTAAQTAIDDFDMSGMRSQLQILNSELAVFDDADFFTGFNPQNWSTGLGALWDKVFGDDTVGKAQEMRAKLESEIAFIESRLNDFGPNLPGDGLANLLGPALGEVDRSFENATMSAKEFSRAVEDVNAILSGRANFRDYQAAIDAVSESLKENGRTLDVNTAKGRANQEALDSIAATALSVAEGIKNADVRADFLANARREFIQAAIDLGALPKKARELADALGLLGRTKVPPITPDVNDGPAKNKLKNLEAVFKALFGKDWRTVLDANSQPGMSKAKSMERLLQSIFGKDWKALLDGDPSGVRDAVSQARSYLNSIDGDRATVYIDTFRTITEKFFPGSQDAMGGMHYNGARTFALGGMDRPNGHLPEFASPGPTRMWREPETKGESYIPWANDHRRPRAKSVLEQTAGLFGGQVEWFATGGMSDWRDYYSQSYPGSTHSSSSSNRLSDNAIDRQINALLASLGGLTAGLHGLSKKERDIRERDLERTAKQLDRLLDEREERAKKEADADKARLKSMIDMQRSFEEQVSGLNRANPFEKGETQRYVLFPDGSRVPIGDLSSITQQQSAYFEQSNAQIVTDSGVGGAAGIYESNIAAKEESIRLYQELRAKGFDGPAFRELVGQADVESLRAYAAMSREQLHQLEVLDATERRLSGVAGSVVGKDFNADIRGLRKDYQESSGVYRDVLQENKQINRRLDSIERVLNKAPGETGKAVGVAVNGAMTNGARGR